MASGIGCYMEGNLSYHTYYIDTYTILILILNGNSASRIFLLK